MINFLLIPIFIHFFYFHPIHISITDIEWNTEKKNLEIISKVFIDDLEKEIGSKTGNMFFSLSEENVKIDIDTVLKNYLKKNVSYTVNNTFKPIEYVGYEINNDAIYIYYQLTSIKKLKSIGLKNTILTNFYDDQVNMIHIKWKNELKSMRTTASEPNSSLELN